MQWRGLFRWLERVQISRVHVLITGVLDLRMDLTRTDRCASGAGIDIDVADGRLFCLLFLSGVCEIIRILLICYWILLRGWCRDII